MLDHLQWPCASNELNHLQWPCAAPAVTGAEYPSSTCRMPRHTAPRIHAQQHARAPRTRQRRTPMRARNEARSCAVPRAATVCCVLCCAQLPCAVCCAARSYRVLCCTQRCGVLSAPPRSGVLCGFLQHTTPYAAQHATSAASLGSSCKVLSASGCAFKPLLIQHPLARLRR
jgi:hypothetical protein